MAAKGKDGEGRGKRWRTPAESWRESSHGEQLLGWCAALAWLSGLFTVRWGIAPVGLVVGIVSLTCAVRGVRGLTGFKQVIGVLGIVLAALVIAAAVALG